MAAPVTPIDRMVVDERPADSDGCANLLQGANNDHTYYINPFVQDEYLQHIAHAGTPPAMDPVKAYYRNCCKMLSIKVKQLKEKLAVLLSQQGKKVTSQASFQTDPGAETTQDKLKQLMSKYEQALKELHKYKVMCKTLQKLKSEQDTTQKKVSEVSSGCELHDACCTERDQYKSEVEQLKKLITQKNNEMGQLRTEVEQLRKQTLNTTNTPRDKRCKSPSSLDICPAPAKKCHMASSEIGVLLDGDSNGFNIMEEDSIPNLCNSRPRNSTGTEGSNTEIISASVTPLDRAGINMKANSQASQLVPNISDYYNLFGGTTVKELLHQSSDPAVDKDYYIKCFKELSAKVKDLESQLEIALVQEVKRDTSQALIQTDPDPEFMLDGSRTELVSQYEQAMNEVQILKRMCTTLQDQISKPGSAMAKEVKVQDISEVDNMAILTDQVFRKLLTCCTERDLYKSEAEQLNQQKLHLDSENKQLRIEVVELKKITQNAASTSMSRDQSSKLRNLRVNAARLLALLSPDLKFPRLVADVGAIDGILQQVLKETEK